MKDDLPNLDRTCRQDDVNQRCANNTRGSRQLQFKHETILLRSCASYEKIRSIDFLREDVSLKHHLRL